MASDAGGSDLSLGVPQIDREHREILGLADDFRAALEAGSPKSELQRRVGELVEVVAEHFSSEESLMLSTGYAGREAHEQEHKRLLGQIRLFESEFASGKIKTCDALALFIDAWTRQHIVGPDQRFAEFLKETRQVAQ